MARKTIKFSAAAAAATMLFTFANAEGSSAFAQEEQITEPAVQIAAPVLTDEVVPVFEAGEVVQPIPEETEEDERANAATSASSLRELVALTDTSGDLSENMQCLAGAIYFESRGEPLSGQLAVGQVIVNRAESRRFPSDYCGVVFQRSQFSFVRGGAMPKIRTNTAAWRKAKALAHIVHQGMWDSEAGDSLYFHAKYVKPRWASRKEARVTINRHIFYR